MGKLFFSSGALAGNPFPIDRKSLATGKKKNQVNHDIC